MRWPSALSRLRLYLTRDAGILSDAALRGGADGSIGRKTPVTIAEARWSDADPSVGKPPRACLASDFSTNFNECLPVEDDFVKNV